MDLNKTGYEGVDMIQLLQWWTLWTR